MAAVEIVDTVRDADAVVVTVAVAGAATAAVVDTVEIGVAVAVAVVVAVGVAVGENTVTPRRFQARGRGTPKKDDWRCRSALRRFGRTLPLFPQVGVFWLGELSQVARSPRWSQTASSPWRSELRALNFLE